MRLRPLEPAERAAFFPAQRLWYTADLVENGGLTPAEAAGKAGHDHAAVLPDGPDTAAQEAFAVELRADGRRAGYAWLQVREGAAYLYWLSIDEQLRRQGLGRAALAEVVALARSRGCDRLELSVFAGNTGARALYLSAGFEARALWLVRRL